MLLKQTFTFLLMIVVLKHVRAQGTQRGVTREQNSNRKAVPGVQINAKGAVVTTSDDHGVFRLSFGTKKPGERISFNEIRKAGFEIVNQKEIDEMRLSVDPDDTFRIILCRQGLLAENKAKYYEINRKAWEADFNKKINALQKQLKAKMIDEKIYREKLEAAESVKVQMDEKLEDYADLLAVENFDDASPLVRSAFDQYTKGNIDTALALLQTINSALELEKAKREKAEGQQLLALGQQKIAKAEQVIKEQTGKLNFQASLYAIKGEYDSANAVYRMMVMAEPDNLEYLSRYAAGLQFQNRYDEVIDLYESVAQRFEQDTLASVLIYNTLGIAYNRVGKYGLASIYFNRAEALTGENKNRDASTDFQRATTLINQSNLEKEMGDAALAERHAKEALSLYQQHKEAYPQQYAAGIATAYATVGLALKAGGQFDSAIYYYKLAIDACKKMMAQQSENYSPYYALLLNDCAGAYAGKQDWAGAEVYMKESVGIKAELAKEKVQSFRTSYAIGLQNLGLLYMHLEKPEQALDAYRRAKAVLLEGYENNPLGVASAIHDVYFNIFSIEKEQKRFTDAAKTIQEHIKLLESLEKREPGAYAPEHIRALMQLAMINVALNNSVDARKSWDAALVLAQYYGITEAESSLMEFKETYLEK